MSINVYGRSDIFSFKNTAYYQFQIGAYDISQKIRNKYIYIFEMEFLYTFPTNHYYRTVLIYVSVLFTYMS